MGVQQDLRNHQYEFAQTWPNVSGGTRIWQNFDTVKSEMTPPPSTVNS